MMAATYKRVLVRTVPVACFFTTFTDPTSDIVNCCRKAFTVAVLSLILAVFNFIILLVSEALVFKSHGA